MLGLNEHLHRFMLTNVLKLAIEEQLFVCVYLRNRYRDRLRKRPTLGY